MDFGMILAWIFLQMRGQDHRGLGKIIQGGWPKTISQLGDLVGSVDTFLTILCQNFHAVPETDL